MVGRYDIIGVMIRDPRDIEMPKSGGQFLIEDPFSGERLYIDASQYAKAYAAETKREEEFVRNSFEKVKLGFISLRTDQDFQEPIMKYLRKRMSLIRG
jgi:hypothetical protein